MFQTMVCFGLLFHNIATDVMAGDHGLIMICWLVDNDIVKDVVEHRHIVEDRGWKMEDMK